MSYSLASINNCFRYAASLALGLSIAACAPAIEFDPWDLPMSDDTLQLGYAGPDREVAEPIHLVEEMHVGGDDTSAVVFGRSPPRLAVGTADDLYILDGSNRRVVRFDSVGSLVGSMGRGGQGPGEFRQPTEIVRDGDRILVWDAANARLSQWSLAGQLLESAQWPARGGMYTPTDGGLLVRRYVERLEDGQTTVFHSVNRSLQSVVEFARVPWPERVVDPPFGEISGTESDAWWVGTVPPAYVADDTGVVFLSAFEHYQVFAFEADGTPRWALQVAEPRQPLARLEIDSYMEIHARRFPQRTEANVPWPERQYALAHLALDGHGHLYVFPYFPRFAEPSLARPVDVYSASGERLYSGSIEGSMFEAAYATYNGPMLEVAWQAAAADHIWGLSRAPRTGDWRVVRWRLDEPF